MNAEKRKLQSCGLRVAPEIGLTVCCGQDFVPKRNPQLSLAYVFCFVSVRVLVYLYIVYILLYMYIYLYIIYNIIKNKKKNLPTGLHIHRRKNGYTTKVAGCVFGENRLYSMLWIGFGAQPVTCNLQPWLRFCFYSIGI